MGCCPFFKKKNDTVLVYDSDRSMDGDSQRVTYSSTTPLITKEDSYSSSRSQPNITTAPAPNVQTNPSQRASTNPSNPSNPTLSNPYQPQTQSNPNPVLRSSSGNSGATQTYPPPQYQSNGGSNGPQYQSNPHYQSAYTPIINPQNNPFATPQNQNYSTY